MALEESGLGEAIVGWGLEDELRQPTFAIGLKGVAKEDIPKVEKLIEDTIAKIAAEGFTQAAIDSSVNTIEFSMRENNTGRFPRGLSLMLRSLSAWLYEGDPVMPLRFEEPLAQLKERMAKEDVFTPLIKKLLIENKHQVTIELNPDKQMAKAQEDAEKARIAKYREGLSPEELEKVVAETEELKRLQETPDTPEALACVPTLAISDIPKEAKNIPTDVGAIGETEVLTHDIATSEILYAEHLMVRPDPLASHSSEGFFSRVERVDRARSVNRLRDRVITNPNEPFAKTRAPYHASRGPHCEVGDRAEAH